MSLSASPLFGPLFASAKMRALFSDEKTIARMLAVEAGLARAEAKAKIIPLSAVTAITAACSRGKFDLRAIGEAAANAGNIAIPLVKALTVEVAKRDKEAARFVHWGVTSQDIIDTAAVLGLREAATLLERDLARAANGFIALAKKHRKAAMPGRTWMQHALPTVFGLKAAGYASALARARSRMLAAMDEASALQFGGAAGTLAALKSKGTAVAKSLAVELELSVPDSPWHSHGDRVVNVASAIGIAIGTCGKIARDISLLMQTEIGEVFEPAAVGRGGSSTMPQKRNPVLSAQILAAANLAPGIVSALLAGLPQEQERGLGGWQASWLALPQLLLLASGTFERTAEIARGLEVDTKRMRANLDITQGQILAEAVQMALGEKLGRLEAHELLEKAAKRAQSSGQHLKDALREMPEIAAPLPGKKLDELFDPANYLGSADELIDKAIGGAAKLLGK